MKIYVLFCIFVINITAYAQCKQIPSANFENESALLGIASSNSDNQIKTPYFAAAKVVCTENENYSTNRIIISDSCELKRFNLPLSPLKNLSLHQNIDLYYSFIKKIQLAFVNIQKNNLYKYSICQTKSMV